MGWRLCTTAALAGLLGAAGVAHAQYSVPAETSTGGRTASVRTKTDDELVREPGWEVGSSLNFVTSDGGPAGDALGFTDLVLLRAHGLVSLGESTEIFAGTDLLPKQPTGANDLAWQGALVGARRQLGDEFAAYVRAEGGPQVGRSGYWLAGDAAGQFKLTLEDGLYWESALGGGYTQLLHDAATDSPFWLVELLARTGIAIRDPRGLFGAWLNFTFHFPLAHQPGVGSPDPESGLFLDPQTRVDFQLGGLIGISPIVDLFFEWSILDRGDAEVPGTTLPMINGGFDQQQLVFGFMRRFGGQRGDD